MKRLRQIGILLFGLLINFSAQAQCAMCRATAETYGDNEPGGTSILDGLAQGILYLIAISYIILFFMFRKKIIKFFKELSSMKR